MTKLAASLCLALLGLSAAVAADPPDSELNPQTGYIETAYTTLEGGTRVARHAEDRGATPNPTTLLDACESGCDGARIVISPDGDSWIVWWHAGTTKQVRARRHDLSAETWSSLQLLSDSDEDSLNAEIAWFSGQAWVVFEAAQTSGTGIAVGIIADEPDPVGSRVLLATAAISGEIDARIHSENDHLWVTWVDSANEVGWVEFQTSSSSWSTAGYVSYSDPDVEAGLGEVRGQVLGL